MACRTAQQTTQYIAPALVGRQDAVGSHERHGTNMIGNDTH